MWDYEEGAEVNVYENHNGLHKGVSRMCLLNELDDSLLLLVSSKGLPILISFVDGHFVQ